MSQEKVNRYKEEKANRKKIMRQQKIKRRISTVVVTVLCIACVGYIGYSAYDLFQSNETVEKTEVNLNAIDSYLSTVS